MRGYNAFLGEEAAQVKKLTPNIGMTTVTATCMIRTATDSDTNGTVLVASAAQLVSVPNAHCWRNIQIQNLGFGASATGAGGSDLTPATRGGFSFGVIMVQRWWFWVFCDEPAKWGCSFPNGPRPDAD